MKRLPGSGLPSATSPSLGVVPRSFRGSVFDRYKRREGVAAIGTMLVAAVGFPLAMFATGMALGAGAAMALGAVELAIFLAGVNRLAALGHGRFQQELGTRVPSTEGAWFVGLSGPDANTAQAQFFTPRLDTDDNVGFLRLLEDGLHISTEEASFVIPRSGIRAIRTEQLVSIPTQPLIAIDWDDEGGARSRIYVVAREGHSLMQHRQKTLELLTVINAWHGEHVDKFLEAELGMTFSG